MPLVHLTNPHRKNVLNIILSFVCVPFPLGSTCNTEFLLDEDITSLKQIKKMCKCVLS